MFYTKRMIEEKTTWKKTELAASSLAYLTGDMLLVDIETTGLSPARDTVYCIGCGFPAGEEICVTLFFAERPDEEREILRAFYSLAKPYATLVSFNGTTFDLPFLKKRTALLFGTGDEAADPRKEESGSGDPVQPVLPAAHIDLYREAAAMRRLLGLSSYKQTELECFLGFSREPDRPGGELIEFYLRYSLQPDPALLMPLLSHNRSDVRGMFSLLALLSYRQFGEGSFSVAAAREETGDAARRLLEITLLPERPLPQAVRGDSEEISFLLDRERTLVRLPIRHGTLKHFFSDYREYYYLPAEDTAVHKSVGSFVDPAHRRRATKQTCYVKKECDYVSLPIRRARGAADDANASFAADRDAGAAFGYLRKEYVDPDICLELPVSGETLKELLRAWFAQNA